MSVKRNIDSIVFAPPAIAGGVKSLYSVCAWLSELGRSSITPFDEPTLASWFTHHCELYDYSYSPDVLIYPEVYQPHVSGVKYHICFALGHRHIEPHADLTVCRSYGILNWLKEQQPEMPATLILPGIDRSIFEYDRRPKQDIICVMSRPHKHPETARFLRDEYGDKVMEIVDFSEAAVAEALRNAKVFVWRGADQEGSPRPPKEALVAGCVVVGLESDLDENHHIDFGIRCSSVDELIRMAGEALQMPVPTDEQRSVIRDSTEEKQDWLALLQNLEISGSELEDRPSMMDRREGGYKLREDQVAPMYVVQTLTERVLEKEARICLLLAEFAEKEQAVQELSGRLADHRQSLQELSGQLADHRQSLQALSARSADDQHSIETLSRMSAAKETELKRITSTLGWRILSLYGRIKYPYLLPLYRLLRLDSSEPKR